MRRLWQNRDRGSGCRPTGDVPVEVDRNLLETLPDTLRLAQELFEATGGIHAAGIFDRHGSLLCSYEDIGRHNAVDKVVGHFVLKNAMPLSDRILVVSGRAGFELVQKALKPRFRDGVGWCRVESRRTDGHRRRMALYSFAGPGHGNLHVKD